jgi:hypothetical protein
MAEPAATQAPPQANLSSAPEAGIQPQGAPAVYEIGTGANVSDVITSNRMIIKNAVLKLQIIDTEVAIDGVTQIAGDLGGYIISSRVWYQTTMGQSQKYAAVTLGVPAGQFEFAMRRLRGLAIKVLDETASGEDVTDQYVDLQSQLANLDATRNRILTFLDDAKTVNEALQINQELTKIEQQIEEIKGRINYLQGRSAYSTITISLEPPPPEIVPTLTPTPIPTATPTPTPTPIPWKPGETFNRASDTLVTIYQALINLLIWILVVVVPLLAPLVVIGWGVWYLVKRRSKK